MILDTNPELATNRLRFPSVETEVLPFRAWTHFLGSIGCTIPPPAGVANVQQSTRAPIWRLHSSSLRYPATVRTIQNP